MNELGVNIDALASFNTQTIVNSGTEWVRVVATPEKNLTPFIKRLHNLNSPIKTLLAIARESVESLGWEDSAYTYQERYQGLVDAWQIGNEPDIISPSSWTMEPEELNDLIWTFRNIMPQEKFIGGGLASGNPSYLDRVDLTWIQGVAVHPYGQGTPNYPSPYQIPGNVELLLSWYQEKILELGLEKELWVTEWGANDMELGRKWAGEYTEAMMSYLRQSPLVSKAFHFCFSDKMVSGFGLKTTQSKNKPAYFSFKKATQT